MGLKRIIDTDFWTDQKVIDEFSPEDKYFMMYLLTNPFSSLLGIYEISIKQAAFHLGWDQNTIHVLLDRFENQYHMILYSPETSEIAIKNFLRHTIIKGGKPIADCLWRDIRKVKNKALIEAVIDHVMNYRDLNVTVMRVLSDYLSGAGYPDLDKYKDNEKANGNENGKENGNGKGNGNGVTPPVTGYVTGYDTQGKNKSVGNKSANPFMSFAKGGL